MPVMPETTSPPSPMKVVLSASGLTLASTPFWPFSAGVPDAGRIDPEIIFRLAGGITCIGEGRLAAFHQAADMVAMHVGQHNDRHSPRGLYPAAVKAFGETTETVGAPAFTKPCVEQNDIRTGVDEHRGRSC